MGERMNAGILLSQRSARGAGAEFLHYRAVKKTNWGSTSIGSDRSMTVSMRPGQSPYRIDGVRPGITVQVEARGPFKSLLASDTVVLEEQRCRLTHIRLLG